ncbi:MAG: AraC family transcriptional regulator [Lachnospiraceae bacterium]|nr:AraC family transcriptional regulator [Lachnospiraceae bacterium]
MKKKEHGIGFDFSAFLEYDLCSDFTLHEIGYFQCSSGYSYGPSIRSRTIIHYVHSGKGVLYLNEIKYEIKAHEAFIIPAGVSAYYEADANEPWRYSWLHLSGPTLNNALEQAGLNIENPVYIPSQPNLQIEEALNTLLTEYENPYIAISRVYEFFHFLISNSSSKKKVKVDSQISYVKNTIRYIQNRYSLNIKVSDIATALGVNRSYLSRLFKEATGSTIQDYLLSYRMNEATKLLANPHNSVSYVSFAVGYSDAVTFSKAYKRYTGINPSEVTSSQLVTQKH